MFYGCYGNNLDRYENLQFYVTYYGRKGAESTIRMDASVMPTEILFCSKLFLPHCFVKIYIKVVTDLLGHIFGDN